MLGNYIKIFFRNLWKHAGYSICNISGLAVGMVTCILVLLFVRYEFSWNTSNKNYKNIYRIQQKAIFKNDVEIYTQTGYPLAKELKGQFPEIDEAIVVKEIWDEYLSSNDTSSFLEKKGFYAHNDIFKVFTFNFIQGNPQNALTDPYSIVLTEELANKYFPGQNAIGKTIKGSQNKFLKVTGIIADLPFNSYIRPEYIVSFNTYPDVTTWKEFSDLKNIDAAAFRSYVLLKPNANVTGINSKISNFIDKYVSDNNKKLYLKPLSEVYLTGDERNDIKIALFYLGGVAIFVLVLACINFINLATAGSGLRKKEIGVRKVVGASKFSLFRQFIGESLFHTFIAIFLALMLVELLIPHFNTIVQRPLKLNYLEDFDFIASLIAAFLFTGFLSGVYPAFYLSSFKPADVIKGNISILKKKDHSKSFLRRAMVAFQFSISISLIITTIFVMKQVSFMKNKDLGFNKENLLLCRVFGDNPDGNFESLRNELISNPGITDASISINAPFNGYWGKEINWEGADPNDKMAISYNSADYNFLNTYGMKLKIGRNFSSEFPTDSQACIINETAMKRLGWSDPIGKKIDDNKYTIIGVVKDFHQYSVHAPIPAVYITLKTGSMKEGGIYAVRVKPGAMENSAGFVREEFRKFFPGAIIEVSGFTRDLDVGTKDVWEIVEKVFFFFTIIAILIAANGLFGLVSFSAQRRIKEIGIRKVLGAKTTSLYVMMSKEFFIILAIAIVLALPSGYFSTITTPGAYKYKLQFIDYFIAVGLMFISALAATLYQTTKAVLSNPVESLKYE